MNYPPIQRLGIFALTGSIVNDAFLFGEDSFLTWAKLLFAAGLTLTLTAGVSAKQPSKTELAVMLYALVLPLITLLSNGPGITSKSIAVTTSLGMGAITFSVFLRLRSKPSTIIKSYVTWAVIGVFIGIVQATSGKLFIAERIFPSGVIEGTYRASGLMSDPNYFALTCLLGIAFGNAIRAHRIVQLILALGVLISGSRAGILVLFIFIALNALTHTPPKKRAALAIIGIGLAATLTPLLKSHLPESISMLFNPASYSQDADRNSLQDRVVAISAALTAFGENPIFGYGLGNLVLHPQNTHQQVSHNSYIELLAETGLAGFFFYCALCFYLTNSTRHPKALGALRLSESTSRRSAIVAFLFFSAMSLTLVTYYSRIFFFSMAIVFLLTKRSANE